MKHQSDILALKYRPTDFNDLIGQEYLVETIQKSIELNKIPNAYIFTGIRGVGKTTTARIVAKMLNCTAFDQNKKPDLSAKLLSEIVTIQLEKRIPFRRAMKMVVQTALKAGAEGIQVKCSGRLGGVEIARSEWYQKGRMPLHTIRAKIDYHFNEANTIYGKIGVKVWVNLGEHIDQSSDDESTDQSENKRGA